MNKKIVKAKEFAFAVLCELLFLTGEIKLAVYFNSVFIPRNKILTIHLVKVTIRIKVICNYNFVSTQDNFNLLVQCLMRKEINKQN